MKTKRAGIMIRKFLKNKKGVTLLEGLIALLLLALVAAGTFAVLLSAARKSMGPDIREEMALAIEKASDLLQGYVYVNSDTISGGTGNRFAKGLCDPTIVDAAPLSTTGSHDIKCLLPPICDRSNSSFTYTISVPTLHETNSSYPSGALKSADVMSDSGLAAGYTRATPYRVVFDINCNGFSL